MIFTMATKKNNNSVQLTDETKKILEAFKKKVKIPYSVLIELTIKWLDSLTEVERAAIWGILPEPQAPEILKLELERRLSSDDKSAEEFRARLRSALDRSAADPGKPQSSSARRQPRASGL